MAGSKIDWDFWFAMPEVAVWQAIALSLDINPDRLEAYQNGPPARDSTLWKNPVLFHNTRLCDEFDKRCRLLGAIVGDHRYFTAGTRNLQHSSRHGVKLIDVARWLKTLSREPLARGMLLRIYPTAGADSMQQTMPKAVEQIAPPQQLRAWQEDQIHHAALALEYNPLALPQSDPKTKFYVKVKIRARCEQDHGAKMRSKVFDKAWDRMMSRKALKYLD